MSRYNIVDAHGEVLPQPSYDTLPAIKAGALRWDEECPEAAPHRVEKVKPGEPTVSASNRAVVGQRVARLPFLAGDGGASPTPRLHFTTALAVEVNQLLSVEHYLGPVAGARYAFAGWTDDVMVACQVWRWPTARMLPSDGTWLELSRWCLTPDAGKNAGSRMMRWVARFLRLNAPTVTTLVSYSDPSQGHTGALYRASGWTDAPTHITRRWRQDGIGYASGNGSWDRFNVQHAKERWLFELASVEVSHAR